MQNVSFLGIPLEFSNQKQPYIYLKNLNENLIGIPKLAIIVKIGKPLWGFIIIMILDKPLQILWRPYSMEATFAHVCVNGYGERGGNAAFEEVVMNLEQMGIKTGIQLNRLLELSQKVEEIFAFPLSADKPIVGANAFSHESGLHINAIVSHPISYEPINPAIVGQQRRFYLGKFSGSSAILDAMQTKLKMNDIDLPDEIIKKIVQDVKAETRTNFETRHSRIIPPN